MSEQKYPDNRILIVGSASGSRASDMASLHKLTMMINAEIEQMKVAMYDMGEAGKRTAEAGTNLGKAFRKIQMPEMQSIKSPSYDFKAFEESAVIMEMDFSRIETLVLDSLTKEKQIKELNDAIEPPEKDFTPKPQNELWANKWNKKIKKK